MTTSTHTETVTLPKTSTGNDLPDLSHFAKKEDIMQALINGGMVTALCGVQFQPIRDPQKFPVCEECKNLVDMANELLR